VFYPGGHGPLWDLSQDANSIALIEAFYKLKRPMTFVCHAPAALLKALTPEGKPLVMGKTVTGFSNTEEEDVNLTDVVPFLLEDELKKAGGQYSKRGNWKSYVKKDGDLITGQNPQSSGDAAKMMLDVLRQQRKQVY
jgi:putative intracellular protease/amidase